MKNSNYDYEFLNIITDENDRNHIINQLKYAVMYLGEKFDIPFSEIVNASFLAGLSYGRRGATFSEDFILILGDILALKGIEVKDAKVMEKPKEVDTEEDLKKIEESYKAVYGIMDKDKELVYIGMSMNVKKRLSEYKMELIEEKKKNTSEFLRKKIPDGEYLEFGKNYSFTILAVPPEHIVYEFGFQKKFLLSYMECKLILENTYSKGNRESYTGDRCIPLKIQKEMFAKQKK